MIAAAALAVAALALAVALIVAGSCCRRGPGQPPQHREPYRPRRFYPFDNQEDDQ